MLVEVLVLVVNGWRCPLTSLAARYTDDRRANFDIYLPLWLAANNKRIFGTLFVGGLVFSVWRWRAEARVVFAKQLREGVRRGRIRCSVRIWQRPKVKAGGRYPMDEGHIVVDSVESITRRDITHDLARDPALPASRTCWRWRSTGPAGTCT